MNKIFLDNASTTKPFEEVVKVIYDENLNNFYNPGALYADGFVVKQKIEDARNVVLSSLGASEYRCVFTASATESNNLSFFQIKKNATILIGAGEHPAVYENASMLQKNGITVKYISLLSDGQIDFEDFKAKCTSEVSFVSVMQVSNETGTINPIKEMCAYAKQQNPKVVFHTDGTQGFMKIKTNLQDLGVDIYTISAHKIHGPKGVGAFIYSKNCNIKAQLLGGGQENGVRSGTENEPLICGFTKAIELTQNNITKNFEFVKTKKVELLNALKKQKIDMEVQGNIENDSPYILAVSFIGVRGEVLLHSLEKYGIQVSTGSACSTKKIGNRILQNMHKGQAIIEGNIRFSFDAYADFDANYVAEIVAKEVNNLKKVKGKN